MIANEPLAVKRTVTLVFGLLGVFLVSIGRHALQIGTGLELLGGVKVSDLNLWKFIVPLMGAVLSWLIVPEEHPDILTVSGMIIIAGSLISFFFKSPSKTTIN